MDEGTLGREQRADKTFGLVRAQIDADFEAHLETIRAYLRQPSVSGTGEGIETGAAMTAELIEMAGGSAEVVPTGGHPAVVGRVEGAGPSLLRYGMYDVQPAEEPTWSSPPFAAEIRTLPQGPSIVARGSANSKGCLAAFFCALASARKIADVPVDLGVICDGEEELGSPNLPGVLESHRDALAAEAAFDLDLTADERDVPWVTLGCKGIVSLRLTATGGDWGGPLGRALHSSTGVAVASPAWSLVRALDCLTEEDESPAVPGLERAPVPPEDVELVKALAQRVTREDIVERSDASKLKTDDVAALVEAVMYAPAVNINGIEAGYAEGGKTIIPNEAHAVVDMRVPYGHDLDAVARSAEKRIHEVAPEVEVEPFELCPPAKTSADSVVARALVASHTDVGARPLVWPVAPWWAPLYLFEQVLEIPFASGGAGHSGRPHAADEYATIAGLRAHMHQSMAFLWRYAERAA